MLIREVRFSNVTSAHLESWVNELSESDKKALCSGLRAIRTLGKLSDTQKKHLKKLASEAEKFSKVKRCRLTIKLSSFTGPSNLEVLGEIREYTKDRAFYLNLSRKQIEERITRDLTDISNSRELIRDIKNHTIPITEKYIEIYEQLLSDIDEWLVHPDNVFKGPLQKALTDSYTSTGDESASMTVAKENESVKELHDLYLKLYNKLLEKVPFTGDNKAWYEKTVKERKEIVTRMQRELTTHLKARRNVLAVTAKALVDLPTVIIPKGEAKLAFDRELLVSQKS